MTEEGPVTTEALDLETFDPAPPTTGRTWLHFVGQTYYPDPDDFAYEARKHGVSRRVSMRQLQKMEWGDRVLLAMKDGASALVFGSFEIGRLTGLSEETVEAAGRGRQMQQISSGPRQVVRGCGSYVIGATYAVQGRLSEIAAEVDGYEPLVADDRAMIAGDFREHPRVRLGDVPHRMGFRMFDYETFLLRATAEAERHARQGIAQLPKVSGQFYADPDEIDEPTEQGEIQEVLVYRRLEELEEMREGEQPSLLDEVDEG